MNNPYTVLGISQNATKVEIVKAQVKALRLKNFDAKEVVAAQKELHNPARRLAVDFTYPVVEEWKSIDKIESSIKSEKSDLNKFNPNKYKS
jgi:proline racemase